MYACMYAVCCILVRTQRSHGYRVLAHTHTHTYNAEPMTMTTTTRAGMCSIITLISPSLGNISAERVLLVHPAQGPQGTIEGQAQGTPQSHTGGRGAKSFPQNQGPEAPPTKQWLDLMVPTPPARPPERGRLRFIDVPRELLFAVLGRGYILYAIPTCACLGGLCLLAYVPTK
jgi:hypothetical protein